MSSTVQIVAVLMLGWVLLVAIRKNIPMRIHLGQFGVETGTRPDNENGEAKSDFEEARVGDKVWLLPREEFIALWNAAASLDELAAQILARVGPRVPRWAVMARAAELRKDGADLKALPARPGAQ